MDANPDWSLDGSSTSSIKFIRQEYYAGKPPISHVFEDPILFDPPILDVPGAFQYWLPKKQRQIEACSQAIALLNEQ